MKHRLASLTQLAESDLIWIDRFAQTLRTLDPAFALPDRGREADRLARGACGRPALRRLTPQEAAARWLGR
jgi:hypothetical protein